MVAARMKAASGLLLPKGGGPKPEARQCFLQRKKSALQSEQTDRQSSENAAASAKAALPAHFWAAGGLDKWEFPKIGDPNIVP